MVLGLGRLLLSSAGVGLAGAVAIANTTATPTKPYPKGPPPKIFPTPIRDVPWRDFQCWKSHVDYTSIVTSIYYADETEKIIKTFTAYTYTDWFITASYMPTPDITLCDSVPRVTGKQTPTTRSAWSTSTIDLTFTTTVLPPSPTCTVENFGTICSKLWASEFSIIDRISKAGYTTDYPLDDPERITAVLKPPCTTLDTYITTPTPVVCSLDQQKLQAKVFYWPVQTTGPFCIPENATHSTIPATQTIPGKPNTARYKDLVMTSPTIYYIFDNAHMNTLLGEWAHGRSSAWKPLGHPVRGITLSQDPRSTPVSSAIRTCRGSHHAGYRCRTLLSSFAWEDLHTVPADKYRPSFGWSPIYQGWYTPRYTHPAGLKEEDDQWEICESVVRGDYKPKYVALPTEKWREWNEPWEYDWPESTATATATATVTATSVPDDEDDEEEEERVMATPGSVTREFGPVETGIV